MINNGSLSRFGLINLPPVGFIKRWRIRRLVKAFGNATRSAITIRYNRDCFLFAVNVGFPLAELELERMLCQILKIPRSLNYPPTKETSSGFLRLTEPSQTQPVIETVGSTNIHNLKGPCGV